MTRNMDEMSERRIAQYTNRMKDWDVYWSPEGRKVARVSAKTAKAAIRKAPMPYRAYPGELYAKEAN